ncbi:MAG: oligosaccharide flippase family protein [Flavobacteriaceae bacterium]|nr:oligosaccharide flippase family protein [Flavobacteriaceae bacterium]
MNVTKDSSAFLRHFTWYLSGAIFPLLLNFVKNPIFTRHYSAEDFGILGLVLISVGYLSTVLFSWLTSCLWRFYPKFKAENNLNELYVHLLFLYVISGIIMLILAYFSGFFFENNQIIELIYLAAVHFIFRELLNLYFIVLRLRGKSRDYNLLISIQTAVSFGLLLVLSFIFHLDISAMFYSLIIIDALFILWIFLSFIRRKSSILLNFNRIKASTCKLLFGFGGKNLITTLILMLIVSSDRYIISLYEPMKEVGIYTKTYDVAQMSILALIFIFFSTINPTMNHILENNRQDSRKIVSGYIHAFSFLFIPVVIFASIFSEEITEILLGAEFRSGYVLMPYIFISMLFFGVIKFFENEYKFAGKLGKMAIYFGIGLLVNLILNFALIPIYGMIWAAISTLISYAVILFIFAFNDNFAHFRRENYNNRFWFLLLFTSLCVVVDFILRRWMEFDLVTSVLELSLFGILWFILFYKDIKSLKTPVFE